MEYLNLEEHFSAAPSSLLENRPGLAELNAALIRNPVDTIDDTYVGEYMRQTAVRANCLVKLTYSQERMPQDITRWVSSEIGKCLNEWGEIILPAWCIFPIDEIDALSAFPHLPEELTVDLVELAGIVGLEALRNLSLSESKNSLSDSDQRLCRLFDDLCRLDDDITNYQVTEYGRISGIRFKCTPEDLTQLEQIRIAPTETLIPEWRELLIPKDPFSLRP